ncbi:MAG: hypothetical protein WDZ30_11805 [Cellvibrionaceae bacterium]
MSNRLTRLIIIAAAILAGVSFIALAMVNFDMDAKSLLAQLFAIVILLAVLIGAASLAAWGLRALQGRGKRRTRQGRNHKDNDDEDD